MYREVDEVIAAAAIGTLLWYLTGGLLPLALFSTKMPEEERRSLVDAILNCKPDDVPASAHQKRFGTGFGKPRFMAPAPTTSLADLANRATAGLACTSCTSTQPSSLLPWRTGSPAQRTRRVW